MKRFLCLTLSVLLLIGCLAGCGSSDGTVTQTEAPAAAGAENVTFVFSQSEDIQSTNQFNDNSIVNISIFGLLFDYLIEQDHQGSFAPGLIEEWTQSEDGLTYSFRLKQDVCFSDGHPFTTAALKASWEYAGGDETLAAYSKWSNVAEITCGDDYNMEVTLKEPDATFLVNVAQSAYVDPVEFEELGAEEYWKNPLGCGKYVFKTWDPGNQLVFEKNERYSGENYSNVGKIIFKPISEDLTRVSALQTNEVNLIFAVPYEQLETVKADSNLVIEQMAGSMSLWMGVQCAEPSPCADVHFRKALSACIDRALIASNIYGNATPLFWGAPSFSLGYDESQNGKYFQYDLTEAKQELAESGYTGEPLKFIVPTTWFPKVNEIVQTLVAMFGEVGINADVQLLEGAAYSQARSSGDYDICLQNYRFGVNNAMWYWLQFVFNYGKYNYSNQEALDLLTATYRATNETDSVNSLKQALTLMAEDCAPMIPLLVFETNGAYQKGWDGIRIFPDNHYDIRDVTKN